MIAARGAGGVGKHIAALADVARGDSLVANGTFWRVSSSAVGPFLRSQGRRPGDRGLDRVARPPDIHVGHQAQARRMLDRLVRRPVLAQADRIVREDVDRAHAHQRREAQRVARVVGEHEEGAAVGNRGRRAARGRSSPRTCRTRARRRTRSCRCHPRPTTFEVFDHGQVGAGQVGRAADELRQRRDQRLERRSARPCAWRWFRLCR